MPSCLWDLSSPTRHCAQASAVTAPSATWTTRGSSGFCFFFFFFFFFKLGNLGESLPKIWKFTVHFGEVLALLLMNFIKHSTFDINRRSEPAKVSLMRQNGPPEPLNCHQRPSGLTGVLKAAALPSVPALLSSTELKQNSFLM